jgi:NAD(P)-dependent dehydrogenase (short-subunit alcohol dehydrogenase family)
LVWVASSALQNTDDHSKRTAVVTGALGGIGTAVCDHLHELGWNVIGTDRFASERPGAVQLDMSDGAAIGRVLGALTHVDGLVNNAAIQLYRPLVDTATDEWDDVHSVNLRAPWLCVKALHRQLAAGHGAVVNIASVHAAATSLSIGAYATMKGGLTAFTRAAALELAEHGVRVNSVLPGAIDTPALRAGFDRIEDAEQSLIARTPLHRIGSPREVATVVAFLLDGERSGFVTGAAIPVDGGALARLSSE